jgi:hypothetical protein
MKAILKTLIKSVGLSAVLEIVFSMVLDTIKNPESKEARDLESILIPFGKSLASKYPKKICSTE